MVIVQPAQLTRAPRSCWMAGSAVATMFASTDAISSAIETMPKTSPRRGRGRATAVFRLLVPSDPTESNLIACWQAINHPSEQICDRVPPRHGPELRNTHDNAEVGQWTPRTWHGCEE